MDAPSYLSEQSAGLWMQITKAFMLEPTELELLRLGLEALDRCEEARVILARDGIVTQNRFGQPIAHPAVAIERDARIAATRIFRELALPDAPSEVVKPLQLRRRRRAG